MPEAVDEHFGRAVDAITKGVETADRVNQLAVARLDAGILDQAAILRILLVAQLERMNDGIAETADAELQRAVVADQRARVQADRSEESRVGKEWVSTWRSGWSPFN